MVSYLWLIRRSQSPRIARYLRTTAALGLFLSASGCLDLVKPDLAIDVPGGYRAPHGAPEAATPPLDWWRTFRSPELTALMEESLTSNFDIAGAISQISQADAQVRIAGAPLLPLIGPLGFDTLSGTGTTGGGGGGTTTTTGVGTTGIGTTGIGTTGGTGTAGTGGVAAGTVGAPGMPASGTTSAPNSAVTTSGQNGAVTGQNSAVTTSPSGFSTGSGRPFSRIFASSLSASYVIDVWGKNRAALNAAIENSIGARYNREVVEIATLSTVANTYFTVLASRDRLRIARKNYADANRILGLIKQQFGVGTASDLNVAQQEALVEMVRAMIPPLEQTLGQNMAALAVLLGRAPEHFNTRGGGLDNVAIPRVTPGMPSDLMNRRPDIRLAEEQLKSSGYSVESARAAFFPTIELTSGLGVQSAALRSLFGPGAWFYTVGAGLSEPIFDGGVLLGTFELQKGLQAQNLQAYRKAILSGFSNVEQALIAVEQTTAQERIQENVVRASRRAFTLSEQQMNFGTVNMVTLLQVEQTLFTAEDQLAQDKLARVQSLVMLFQALGGGWPPTTPAQARAQVHAG